MSSYQTNTLETRGRLLLWNSALYETITLLSLAIRAEHAQKEASIIAATKKYFEDVNAFAARQPDYEKGVSKLSHQEGYNEAHTIPFPRDFDCFRMRQYFMMLAAIFFSQLFNTGNSDHGVASANSIAFRIGHLPIIIERAFPTDDERRQFNELADKVKTARDKMIAHADAAFFEIAHDPIITRHNMISQSLNGIDLRQWHKLAKALELEVLRYSHEKFNEIVF